MNFTSFSSSFKVPVSNQKRVGAAASCDRA
jgi:hypothetical protein